MLKHNEVKIRLTDEVNAIIVGLHPDHISYFNNEYALHAPNYFFNPKYKLGSWDGKIRYFGKTGKTYIHLLDEIIPKIKIMGYAIKIEDERFLPFINAQPVHKDRFSHILNEDDEPFTMRPYQVDSVNALILDGDGIIIAGTGAGKTLMNAALVDAYAQADPSIKTITIVPTSDLVTQTKEDFILWEMDTGEYSGDLKDLDHTHVISTWQALQNNPNILRSIQLVVVDECHGLKGQVLTKLLIDYGSHIVHRFGLTGTLPKAETDKMAVHIAVGSVKYTIPAHELIEQDYLAKLDIDILQLEEDFHGRYDEYIKTDNSFKKLTYIQFKDQYFGEYQPEKSYLQKAGNRIEWMASYLESLRDEHKGNVFCLVDGVAFGKKLTKAIPEAMFVYGKDKKAARKEIYNLFKKNDNIIVIATVQVASTGLNIKRIFNLVFIDVGKSFIRVIQTIGRGLRKAKDKDYVKVTDICSDLKYSKKHLNERKKFYTEAKYPHKIIKIDYEKQLSIFNE